MSFSLCEPAGMTELLDFYIERIEREVAVEAHREEAKSRGFWERLTLFGRVR